MEVQEKLNRTEGWCANKSSVVFSTYPEVLKYVSVSRNSKELDMVWWWKISDGQLRHPADSPSWKLVDCKWPDFAAKTRNLRLALSADGINPHSSLSSRYSCWPVIMIIYNLRQSSLEYYLVISIHFSVKKNISIHF